MTRRRAARELLGRGGETRVRQNAAEILRMQLGELLEALLDAGTLPASDWLDARAEGFPVPWRRLVEAARRGELDVARVGRGIYVRRDEFDRWLRTHNIQPEALQSRAPEAPPPDDIAETLAANGFRRAS